MKKPPALLWLSVVAVLAGGAYAGWRYAQTPPVERFRTMTVDRGDIVKAVSANGTLNPVVLVNVGTQVSGTIQKLRADFNDRVKAGQVLVELDPSLFRAALDQSKANLANVQASLRLAQANERRARALFARDYIARADLDQSVQALDGARAQLSAAVAAVRRDQTNLRYSVIVSPVSGIVVSRSVDVGQTVAASFQTPTLFTIAQDLKRMQIDTTVAEADVGGVRVGQDVRFTVDAYSGRDFVGKVRQIRLNSQVLQNVVTYNVVIDVANPEEILLPGMTAFVSIVTAEHKNVLRVPGPALRYKPQSGEGSASPRREGERQVYRLQDGVPVSVQVRTGLSDGKYTEAVSGSVQAGDALVVEDLSETRAGANASGGPAGGQFRVRMF